MYAMIEGLYKDGQVILTEAAPTTETSKVVIMFLENKAKNEVLVHKGVKIGSLAGKGYDIPDNFNELGV